MPNWKSKTTPRLNHIGTEKASSILIPPIFMAGFEHTGTVAPPKQSG